MAKDTRRRPKHYDRPGYRPGPEAQGAYVDQVGAADAREQLSYVPCRAHCGWHYGFDHDVGCPGTRGQSSPG